MKPWISKLTAGVCLVILLVSCSPAATARPPATITPVAPIAKSPTPIPPTPTSLPATQVSTQVKLPANEAGLKIYVSRQDDEAWDVLPAGDGGYYIVGTTKVKYEPVMQGDVYLMRTDADGNVLWEKTYGGAGYDTGQTIFATNNGTLVIGGYTNSFGAGSMDSYLIGIDQNGDELWTKTFGGSLDEMTGALQLPDGGIILSGNIVDPNDFIADPGEIGYGGFAGRSNIYLSKISNDGVVLWEKTYGGENNLLVVGGVLTPDGGGLVLANCLLYPEPGDYIYLLKVDQDGNEVWSRTWQEGTLNAYDIIPTSDGNYLIAGSYTPPEISDHTEADFLFIKVDSQGNEIWRRIMGETGLIESSRGVVELPGGGFVVAGNALHNLTSWNSSDIALFKIDEQGELVWKQIFELKGHAMYNLHLHPEGSYVIAGSLYSGTRADIFMIKAQDPGEAGDTGSPAGSSASLATRITPDTVSAIERLETLTAHTNRVTDVVFSPDGAYLASSGLDKKVRLWDVATWQEVHTFDIHMSDLNAIAFSPDSKLLASARKIWDVETGQVVHEISPGMNEVGHVAFSPDGSLLAVSGHPLSITLWDVANGQLVRNFEMPDDIYGFFSLAFSPDGRQLAAGSPQHGTVMLWDVQSGQISGTLELGDKSDTHDIEFSPDGSLLAAGGTGHAVGIWDVVSGELVDQLPLNNGIYGLAFSPDGKILALASCNRVAQLWNVETGSTLRSLRHSDELMSVDFSPDGSLLATGGYDHTVVIWGVP